MRKLALEKQTNKQKKFFKVSKLNVKFNKFGTGNTANEHRVNMLIFV